MNNAAPTPAAEVAAPVPISAQRWQQIEAGIIQRARLLERVMADVYGAQTLLAQGLLPAALLLADPGYLRAMHGVAPVGGTHLHIAAFDLSPEPEGEWRALAQHTQVPCGLGVLLEHAHEQQLGDRYDAVLTPGPYSEAYLEHASLARSLNLPLVEGTDLVVRDQRLYLKALGALVPVRGLINCLNDAFLDPLELRADSRLGVAGLLQAVRTGNVQMANAPGAAFLESPAMVEVLPALCWHLLGEALLLPAALPSANPLPLTLRVFAVCDGTQSWRVLPGGLSCAGEGACSVAWTLPTGDAQDRRATAQRQPKPVLTSRAAENLYWLGRYTERAHNSTRLARLTLQCLHANTPPAPALLQWLGHQAHANTLVFPTVPGPAEDQQEFVRALMSGLASSEQATSVGYQLRAMQMAGANARGWLSPAQWSLIEHAQEAFILRCALPGNATPPAADVLQALQAVGTDLAAIAQLQDNTANPDADWNLLHSGRQLERLWFTCTALAQWLQTVPPGTDLTPLRALLENPVPVPAPWQGDGLDTPAPEGSVRALVELLQHGQRAAYLATQDLNACFSHHDEAGQSLGA